MGAPQIDTWNMLADYIQSSFQKRYKNTIGCDIATLEVKLPYDHVTISIWDIASTNRFQFFRSTFFKGASCAILAFDLTSYHSFNPILMNFITEIYMNLGAIPLILIGCNADKEDLRQISYNDIEQLRERMGTVVYFEINNDNNAMLSIFETAAELILNHMGISEEDRRIAYEWKQKQLKNIITVLEEMNFPVNEKDEVDIFNHHGLFSINLINGSVTFEPIICSKCENISCPHKKVPRKKTLCIISVGNGYAKELAEHELLILAKIFAIAQEMLPTHVLNQMAEIAHCHNFRGNPHIIPIYDVELPPELIPEEENAVITSNIYATDDISSLITPAEARTLLRNHHIQFFSGRLPYSVFKKLEKRFLQVIAGS